MKKEHCSERPKKIDLMLDKNRTFDCQVELLIRIIYDGRLEQNMEIINGKYEDNDLLWIQCKKWVIYFNNDVTKQNRKCDIKSDINNTANNFYGNY